MVVKKYQLKNFNISELQPLPNNPNQLTIKQKLALQKIIKKYGFLKPIVVDSKTNKIIDGEHRVKILKELGEKQIQGYLIDTAKKDYEKKFLRQVLNKLHGTPDPQLDHDELDFIMEDETGAAMLEDCLDIDREALDHMGDAIPEEVGIAPDEDDEVDKMRKIVLYFTKHEYPEIKEKFERLKEDYSVTTETEVVKALIEHSESSI